MDDAINESVFRAKKAQEEKRVNSNEYKLKAAVNRREDQAQILQDKSDQLAGSRPSYDIGKTLADP